MYFIIAAETIIRDYVIRYYRFRHQRMTLSADTCISFNDGAML